MNLASLLASNFLWLLRVTKYRSRYLIVVDKCPIKHLYIKDNRKRMMMESVRTDIISFILASFILSY